MEGARGGGERSAKFFFMIRVDFITKNLQYSFLAIIGIFFVTLELTAYWMHLKRRA